MLCCSETWLDNRYTDDLVSLPNKTIFRMDRRTDVSSYNARPTAGGVCVYTSKALANYTSCLLECSKICQDFEIITLVTTKPDHRYFITNNFLIMYLHVEMYLKKKFGLLVILIRIYLSETMLIRLIFRLLQKRMGLHNVFMRSLDLTIEVGAVLTLLCLIVNI